MLLGWVAVTSVVIICLTPAAVQGQTLSPQRAFGRYQQFVWNDQHGLPQNSVNAVVRTRDGYLWLGTAEGAARFDGTRFTVFDNTTVPEFRTNFITALVEDRLGHLWFGTEDGLVRLAEGRFTRYDAGNGLGSSHILALLEDRSGALWIGTNSGGLSRRHN